MGSYTKIVVGIDGSNTASKALTEAARLATAADAELIVVSCYQPPDAREISKWQSESPAELSWRFTGTAVVEEVLRDAGESVVTEVPEVKSRTRFEEGEPAETLIRVAEEEQADLLVVGNKGMTGAGRFLLGNVPNKVSHHSVCDVLIVKTS